MSFLVNLSKASDVSENTKSFCCPIGSIFIVILFKLDCNEDAADWVAKALRSFSDVAAFNKIILKLYLEACIQMSGFANTKKLKTNQVLLF